MVSLIIYILAGFLLHLSRATDPRQPALHRGASFSRDSSALGAGHKRPIGFVFPGDKVFIKGVGLKKVGDLRRTKPIGLHDALGEFSSDRPPRVEHSRGPPAPPSSPSRPLPGGRLEDPPPYGFAPGVLPSSPAVQPPARPPGDKSPINTDRQPSPVPILHPLVQFPKATRTPPEGSQTLPLFKAQAALFSAVESCMQNFPRLYSAKGQSSTCASFCFNEIYQNSLQSLLRIMNDNTIDSPGNKEASKEEPAKGLEVASVVLEPIRNHVAFQATDFYSLITCPSRGDAYETLEQTVNEPLSPSLYTNTYLPFQPDMKWFVNRKTLNLYLRAGSKDYLVLNTLKVLAYVIAKEGPSVPSGTWCHARVKRVSLWEPPSAEVTFSVTYSTVLKAKSSSPSSSFLEKTATDDRLHDPAQQPKPKRRFFSSTFNHFSHKTKTDRQPQSCSDVAEDSQKKTKTVVVTCKLCKVSRMACAAVEAALDLATSQPGVTLEVPRITRGFRHRVARWIKQAVKTSLSKLRDKLRGKPRVKPRMTTIMSDQFYTWTRTCPLLALEYTYGGTNLPLIQSAKVRSVTFYQDSKHIAFFIDVISVHPGSEPVPPAPGLPSAPGGYPGGIIKVALQKTTAPAFLVNMGYFMLATSSLEISIEGRQVRFANCPKDEKLASTPFERVASSEVR